MPDALGGTLEKVGVCRRDHGQRVVEFGGQALLPGDRAGGSYTTMTTDHLRRVIAEGCAGPRAYAVWRGSLSRSSAG
jgi:hypothetical protein